MAYVPKAATAEVLDDLRSNGQAAVSLARPTDDRAVQVKGEFLSLRDADASEEAFVLAQWQRLSRTSSTRSAWPTAATSDLADVAVRGRHAPGHASSARRRGRKRESVIS